MFGKRAALIYMGYSIMNKEMNEIFSRTIVNGVEGILALVSLNYFAIISKRKARLSFDGSMIKMTVSITLSFLIRSSSLLAYLFLLASFVLG